MEKTSVGLLVTDRKRVSYVIICIKNLLVMMRRFTCLLPSFLVTARKFENEVASDPVEKLRHLLPSTCDVVGVVASGIVGKTNCPSFPAFCHYFV